MNEYIVGDNLDVMKILPSGSVDLVYLDPPFNSGRKYKGKSGATFEDRWTSCSSDHDGISDDLVAICDIAKKIHSEGMQAYLVFMATRLAEIKRLLKSSGAVYLHCDSTASHYLVLQKMSRP